MYITTQTIHNMDLMTAKLLNADYTPLSNTTLNQKFNIEGDYNKTGNPSINMVVLGMLPVDYIDSGGTTNHLSVKHSALDATVYEPLPFIIRPLTSDLSGGDRSRYRLREVKVVGGVPSAVYYGKMLVITSNAAKVLKMTP